MRYYQLSVIMGSFPRIGVHIQVGNWKPGLSKDKWQSGSHLCSYNIKSVSTIPSFFFAILQR